MLRAITIFLILSISQSLIAQSDSSRAGFHLQAIGLSFHDANVQFFEGYDQQILYVNAQSGLPIYADWNVYSKSAQQPAFFQMGGNVAWADSSTGVKLRLSGHFAQRMDTFSYRSDFAVRDTVFGRLGREKARFFGVAFAGLKQSRKILGFLRLYGGAEVQMDIGPSSQVLLQEFSFDVGESIVVDFQEWETSGKPRFNLYGSAMLGLETIFLGHLGFTFEVKSGLGAQFVLREKTFGLGKTGFQVGLNYYLFDYQRKAPTPPNYEDEFLENIETED